MWEVLLCIRAALAEELIKRGLSQKGISKMLAITQAAVSQYTSKKRGSKGAKEEIKNLVRGSVDDLVVRICRICMEVRTEGAVCKLDLCSMSQKRCMLLDIRRRKCCKQGKNNFFISFDWLESAYPCNPQLKTKPL